MSSLPIAPESTTALAALPLDQLWTALDNLRRVPLAELIAHTEARPAEPSIALKTAILDTLRARENRLRGSSKDCLALLSRALPVLEECGAIDFAVSG
ncbi:MAG: hypothetical protein JNJ55_13890, partial [Betaproteobacteria bacterium]|nr:hypothetical protein [Betaproteobacteria bacterium]